MRSIHGGWHGFEKCRWRCFRRFPETGVGLWTDDGADLVPDAGLPVCAADLCLAELRPVSKFSGAEGFPQVLGKEARWTAGRCHGRAFQADQACRTACRRRRVPAALNAGYSASADSTRRLELPLRPITLSLPP